MESVWHTTRSVLRESGFCPTQDLIDTQSAAKLVRRNPENGPITLFEAVRLGSGVPWVDIEFSDTAFWNWVELRRSWSELWQCLDQVASEIKGSPTSAIAWAFVSSRTTDEVASLLNQAEKLNPKLLVPIPRRRPDARAMISSGKTDSAIANTLGVIRANSGSGYCQIIRDIQDPSNTDEELLRSLDQVVKSNRFSETLQDLTSFVPRQLVRAKAEIARSNGDSQTFSSVLNYLCESGYSKITSDSDLLERLLNIAPEKSTVVAQAMSSERQARQ